MCVGGGGGGRAVEEEVLVNIREQMFQMALLVFKENTCHIILKSVNKYRGYAPEKLNL